MLVKVASQNDIKPGSARTVEANGIQIAIFNIKGSFYAVEGACLHAGGPLGEGFVNDREATVECPWHGWVYSLKTGQTPHDSQKLRTFPVKVQGTDIYLEL